MLMDWPAIDNIFVYFLYQFGPVLVVLAGILMAVTLYRLARHGRWQAAACLLVVLFYGYMETQVILARLSQPAYVAHHLAVSHFFNGI